MTLSNVSKAIALTLAISALAACGGGGGGGGGVGATAAAPKGKPLPGPGGVKAARFPDDGDAGGPSTGGPHLVIKDPTTPISGLPPTGGITPSGGTSTILAAGSLSPFTPTDGGLAAPTFAAATPLIAANPEPASAVLAMMAMGALAMGATRRPRRAL